jgi:hypothetical protein
VLKFGRKQLSRLKLGGPKIDFVDLNTNTFIYLALGEIGTIQWKSYMGLVYNIKVNEVKQWRDSCMETWINPMVYLLHGGFKSKIWISKKTTLWVSLPFEPMHDYHLRRDHWSDEWDYVESCENNIMRH